MILLLFLAILVLIGLGGIGLGIFLIVVGASESLRGKQYPAFVRHFTDYGTSRTSDDIRRLQELETLRRNDDITKGKK